MRRRRRSFQAEKKSLSSILMINADDLTEKDDKNDEEQKLPYFQERR